MNWIHKSRVRLRCILVHEFVCRLNYTLNHVIFRISCEDSSVQRIFRGVSLIRQESVSLYMRNKSASGKLWV